MTLARKLRRVGDGRQLVYCFRALSTGLPKWNKARFSEWVRGVTLSLANRRRQSPGEQIPTRQLTLPVRQLPPPFELGLESGRRREMTDHACGCHGRLVRPCDAFTGGLAARGTQARWEIAFHHLPERWRINTSPQRKRGEGCPSLALRACEKTHLTFVPTGLHPRSNRRELAGPLGPCYNPDVP